MEKTSTLSRLLPLMTDELAAGGEVRFKPRGISMLPFLKEGRDEVVLSRIASAPKKGDIIFYRRADKAFVLHRVVGIKKGGYVLCGDNQYRREYPVTDNQIIATVKGVYRKGKYVDAQSLYFRLFGFLRPKIMLFYGLFARAKAKLGRILRRIFKSCK